MRPRFNLGLELTQERLGWRPVQPTLFLMPGMKFYFLLSTFTLVQRSSVFASYRAERLRPSK